MFLVWKTCIDNESETVGEFTGKLTFGALIVEHANILGIRMECSIGNVAAVAGNLPA